MWQENSLALGKWEHRWFDLAKYVSMWSKDPSTRVGAVAVGVDRKNIAVGFNGFPPGIEDTDERLNDRPTKYLLTQHAERNVLDNAHFDLRGGTIVTTMFPCVECAKSIASKGIKRVITPEMPPTIPGQPSWRDTVGWSLIIFAEAGVEVEFIAEEKHGNQA